MVNAVCHRDYFEKGANVMVEIFDDRVEIYNPGGLPKGLSEKDSRILETYSIVLNWWLVIPSLVSILVYFQPLIWTRV